MANPRRLDPAGSGFHHVHALAFEFILEPTLQYVNELELHFVMMALAELRRERCTHPYHVGGGKPVGCRRDSQVAIERIRTQAFSLEVGLVQVADGEALLSWLLDFSHAALQRLSGLRMDPAAASAARLAACPNRLGQSQPCGAVELRTRLLSQRLISWSLSAVCTTSLIAAEIAKKPAISTKTCSACRWCT